jgi:hypothetical protein
VSFEHRRIKDMADGAKEISKAVQEVAKTTDHALGVGEKAGSFLARIMGESIERLPE